MEPGAAVIAWVGVHGLLFALVVARTVLSRMGI